MTEMKVKAIAPWFGGKRTLAPDIVKELGKHSAYWEPFCGSCAVLFAKPPSSHETINDLHGDLINLARVIADELAAPKLYGMAARVLCDEQRRDESLREMKDPGNRVDRAFHYLIHSWFGRNGFSGTVGCEKSSFAVRWTPNGGHGGQRFASAVESIPAWHHRLRRAAILNRDAFDVIEKIDDHPRVAIYVDPPYLQKSARYEHDFDATGGLFDDDHKRLADMLARFSRSRVVVSYYDHPRLRSLYPESRWKIIDCSITKGLHNAGRRGQKAKKAPEVLIVNGESYTE